MESLAHLVYLKLHVQYHDEHENYYTPAEAGRWRGRVGEYHKQAIADALLQCTNLGRVFNALTVQVYEYERYSGPLLLAQYVHCP